MDEITRRIMELDMEHLTREDVDWLHELKTLVQIRLIENFLAKKKEAA